MKGWVQTHLPPEIGAQPVAWEAVEELRIRSGVAAMVQYDGREQVLAYTPDKEGVQALLQRLTGYSLHAYGAQLRQGFFTLPGGIRVGVSGRLVYEGGVGQRMEDITSLNLRFPRACRGSGRRVLHYLLEKGMLQSTLILSPPGQGKTTLLRDLIRCLSAGDGCLPRRCTVIDEREELWGQSFDLGPRTDVLRCEKREGMFMALRALSPEFIATDELGAEGEWAALERMAAAGVGLLATAHGKDLAQLRSRPLFERLLQRGMVARVVLLSDTFGRGTVQQIWDGAGKPLLPRPLSPERRRDAV